MLTHDMSAFAFCTFFLVTLTVYYKYTNIYQKPKNLGVWVGET